jgi:hypothetical protein
MTYQGSDWQNNHTSENRKKTLGPKIEKFYEYKIYRAMQSNEWEQDQ